MTLTGAGRWKTPRSGPHSRCLPKSRPAWTIRVRWKGSHDRSKARPTGAGSYRATLISTWDSCGPPSHTRVVGKLVSTWVVVLVKDFGSAKQRLGPALDPSERSALARTNATRA